MDADLFRAQELPHALLALHVRARRITEAVALAPISRGKPLLHRHGGGIGEAPIFANAPVQPFRSALGRLRGQRLDRDRLEELALLLPLLGPLPDALARIHDEQRDMVAASLLGV